MVLEEARARGTVRSEATMMSEAIPEWQADTRTDAELRARWVDLQKQGNRSRTEEEGRHIAGQMDSISEILEKRRIHGWHP